MMMAFCVLLTQFCYCVDRVTQSLKSVDGLGSGTEDFFFPHICRILEGLFPVL